MHPEMMEIFGGTLEKTAQWVEDLMAEARLPSRRSAYSALRAVLHVLRDRLTVEEAVDLGAQLPMLVRGFYYEGWRPAGKPLKYRHKHEFLGHVAELYPGLPVPEREPVVRAVFRVLSRYLVGGEIQQVKDQLPAEVRALWETSL